VPESYGAIGLQLCPAYAVDSKTAIRAGFARSFSKLTTFWGSSHYAGSVGTYSFSSGNYDITPAYILAQGYLPIFWLPLTARPTRLAKCRQP
jgi:hypothetical protein